MLYTKNHQFILINFILNIKRNKKILKKTIHYLSFEPQCIQKV